MRLLPLLAAAFAITLPAYADFSYKTTGKTGGAMAAMMASQPLNSTYYFKGQKMRTDMGTTSTIMDFGARTIITINHTAKTITVKSFDDMANKMPSNVDAKIDVKETGQKKMVNGYNASELIMTMEIDSPQTRQMGKMQMEMDMWISPDVPGESERYAFYQKNAANFPWAAMGGGANPAMAASLADAQRKIAAMHGLPVQQVMRVKSPGAPGAPAAPQMTPAQAAQMQAAMAKLEALKAQGGPAAAAAQAAMGRMGGAAAMAGGGAAAGGPMIEVTMDASDFSTASIPDSVFDIPAGYQKSN